MVQMPATFLLFCRLTGFLWSNYKTPVLLQTSVLRTPVLRTSVLQTPVVRTLVLQTPVLRTPVLRTPVLRTPVLCLSRRAPRRTRAA